MVLNDSDGHADKRTRTILAQQFANQGQVVIEVPSIHTCVRAA